MSCRPTSWELYRALTTVVAHSGACPTLGGGSLPSGAALSTNTLYTLLPEYGLYHTHTQFRPLNRAPPYRGGSTEGEARPPAPAYVRGDAWSRTPTQIRAYGYCVSSPGTPLPETTLTVH